MKTLPKCVRDKIEKEMIQYIVDAHGFCDDCKERAKLLIFRKYSEMSDEQLWKEYKDEEVNRNELYHGNIGDKPTEGNEKGEDKMNNDKTDKYKELNFNETMELIQHKLDNNLLTHEQLLKVCMFFKARRGVKPSELEKEKNAWHESFKRILTEEPDKSVPLLNPQYLTEGYDPKLAKPNI